MEEQKHDLIYHIQKDYDPQGIIKKLLFLSTKINGIRTQALNQAADVCQKHDMPFLYDEVKREILKSNPTFTENESKKTWYQASLNGYKEESRKLQLAIEEARQSNNNNQTRQAIIKKAEYQFERGELIECVRDIERAEKLVGDQQKQKLLECAGLKAACFYLRWSLNDVIAIAESKDLVEKPGLSRTDLQTKKKLNLYSSIRGLAFGQYREFLDTVRTMFRIQNCFEICGKNMKCSVSVEDLSCYAVIFMLAYDLPKDGNNSNPTKREEIIQYTKDENLRDFFCASPKSKAIIQNYMKLQNEEVIKLCMQLIAQFKYDIIFSNELHTESLRRIENLILKKTLKDSLKPYSRVKISDFSQSVNFDNQVLVQVIKDLILQEGLDFRIDLVQDCFIQLQEQSLNQAKAYRNSVQAISQYIREKEDMLLRKQFRAVTKNNPQDFDDFGRKGGIPGYDPKDFEYGN